LRWISVSTSNTSDTLDSDFCHPVTSASKVARYRDAIMPCTASWSLSRVSKSSSEILSSRTSEPSLYGSATNTMADQVSFSLRSVSSIFSSFSAWSQISSTSAVNSCRFRSSSCCSFMDASSWGGRNVFLVAFISRSQCRGRMDLCFSDAIRGQVDRKSLICLSRPLYAGDARVFFVPDAFSFFCSPLAYSSMSSGLRGGSGGGGGDKV